MGRQEDYFHARAQFAALRDALTTKGKGEYYRDSEGLVYEIFERFGLFKHIAKDDRMKYADRAILEIMNAAREEVDMKKREKLLTIANTAWEGHKLSDTIARAARRLLVNDYLDKEFAKGWHNIEDLKTFISTRAEELFSEWWDL